MNWIHEWIIFPGKKKKKTGRSFRFGKNNHKRLAVVIWPTHTQLQCSLIWSWAHVSVPVLSVVCCVVSHLRQHACRKIGDAKLTIVVKLCVFDALQETAIPSRVERLWKKVILYYVLNVLYLLFLMPYSLNALNSNSSKNLKCTSELQEHMWSRFNL